MYGLALGYEDLNDHEELSSDPLLATLIGKQDPTGDRRRQKRHKGLPLASASTLGRIERTRADAIKESRYGKVVCDFDATRDVVVDVFIESFDEPPLYLVLDLDPSDIRLHGDQEQRFFHCYYDHYCYLPMYLFCGEYPLAVKLRPAHTDGARVYEFHPWEKRVLRRAPYVGTDVPIYQYLARLAGCGEEPEDYGSIWYYF